MQKFYPVLFAIRNFLNRKKMTDAYFLKKSNITHFRIFCEKKKKNRTYHGKFLYLVEDGGNKCF